MYSFTILKNQQALHTLLPGLTEGIFYLEEEQLCIEIKPKRFDVVDISHALRRGQKCPVVMFVEWAQSGTRRLWQTDPDFVRLFAEAQKDNSASLFLSHNVRAFSYTRKAIRMFSPFAVGRLKPLTELPLRWTVPHVCRALANGQFSEISDLLEQTRNLDPMQFLRLVIDSGDFKISDRNDYLMLIRWRPKKFYSVEVRL